jgi:2-keto-4-pentenoate hydratase/2-oxohepta-3-ene-1,7-dioic acid hydratase in catechol pathway
MQKYPRMINDPSVWRLNLIESRAMKIIRFKNDNDQIVVGALQGDGVARLIEGDIYGDFVVSETEVQVGKLLAPIEPTQILCIGLNYKQHAKESGMESPAQPILFTKGPNTLQHPNEPIELPRALRSDEVDYEVELAVVIGKSCKNATRENALSYVLGYTCANDVSARDWQIKKGGGQWCRGKTFDTFSPLGPCLVTTDDIPNPNELQLRTEVSGKVYQDWNTNDMIFDVPTLIEFLSGSNTLLPGTVILTGTPHGVGMAQKPPRWLEDGDTVSVEIERIGTLTNPVVAEPL